MALRSMKKGAVQKIIFMVLVSSILVLSFFSVAQANGWLLPEPGQIVIENGIVDLSSLSIEQKIAQMTVGIGTLEDMVAWKKLQLGGVYLYARNSEKEFKQIISAYQQDMQIPFMITADFEGCFNPFAALTNSTPNVNITTVGEAFEKGAKDGKFMKDLGFTLNFAPVVDLGDAIWGCRAFPGDQEEIAALAQAYVLGLQDQGIIATAKHYPGKTLVVQDPHKFVVAAEIAEDDIFPYIYLEEKGDVKAIMVSHLITVGSVNSEGVPSVVSPPVFQKIRENGYEGLLISDEIHMLGLKNFFNSLDEMYVGVFAAGNDIILNFDNDPLEVNRMIEVVASAVKTGEISESQIDASVKRILEAKGFSVKE